ncbi:MAG: hypothetical protein JXO72_02210 [Vicinamibacteria bacterium]|nr:hypothetical protein [Vicinamibacteria bacterium]
MSMTARTQLITARGSQSLRSKRRVAMLSLWFFVGASASSAEAAVQPGLAEAQRLFQQNRWSEARSRLRRCFSSLSRNEKSKARFLIGRSFVREAEFYRAVRLLADDVGRDYLKELGDQRPNRGNPYIPLFAGFHALDASDAREAARRLAEAAAPRSRLPKKWQTSAVLRRIAALTLTADAASSRSLAADTTIEGRYWRFVLSGQSTAVEPPARSADRRERLLAACLLFRAGRSDEAEKAVVKIDFDAPDVEVKPDPKKTLRFFDPLTLAALERIQWERAAIVLMPLAASTDGAEAKLGAHYAGLSLFRLGAWDEARALLEKSGAESPGADLKAVARLLANACRWHQSLPSQGELSSLWSASSSHTESVLEWEELRRPGLESREPFASKLGLRLATLLNDSSIRSSGATVGRWGLARLRRNDEGESLLSQLSAHRNHSNKNKLEWNDPLLLLALTGANYRSNEYAQALETLFEMAKTLPGLRGLQWNLQGIYAARQKAGGEARISQ